MNERIVSHVLGLSFLLSVILAGGCMSSPPEKTEMQGTPSEIMIKNISVDDYSVKGENEQNFSEVPQRVIAIGMEEVEMVLAFADMDQILGIYGFNDLQDFLKPEYKEKMKGVNILSRGEVNRERLIELNPDLIVAEQCSYTPGRCSLQIFGMIEMLKLMSRSVQTVRKNICVKRLLRRS